MNIETAISLIEKRYPSGWGGAAAIRKEKGKTITKTLNQKQAKMVKKSLKEMKKINIFVEKWKLVSLRHLEKI